MTTYNIIDFGAVADASALCTESIQAAIDKATRAGGGVVEIPAGTFLSGTIFLKTGVELYLSPGAVLLGSGKLDDYSPQTWGHHDDRTPYHLIFAEKQERISITGPGTIKGQEKPFWQDTRKDDWAFWKEKVLRPSALIELQECTDVALKDFCIREVPGWGTHLFNCTRAQIRGLRIDHNLFGPNSDGLHITGSQEVTISDCHIRSGDDCIAISTTTVKPRPVCYITITNCVFETNCVAVRIGYQSELDLEDIVVSNCVVKRCSRLLDLRTLQGGNIRRVSVINVTGTTNCGWPCTRPIELTSHRIDNVFQPGMSPEHPQKHRQVPTPIAGEIADITLRDISLETDGRVMMVASDEGRIRDINIQNLTLNYPFIDDPTPFHRPGRQISFLPDMNEFKGAKAAIVAVNIEYLRMDNISVKWPTFPVPDKWLLFKSTHRHTNPEYSKDADSFIAGRRQISFHALLAVNVSGKIDFTNTQSGFGVGAVSASRSPALVISGIEHP